MNGTEKDGTGYNYSKSLIPPTTPGMVTKQGIIGVSSVKEWESEITREFLKLRSALDFLDERAVFLRDRIEPILRPAMPGESLTNVESSPTVGVAMETYQIKGIVDGIIAKVNGMIGRLGL